MKHPSYKHIPTSELLDIWDKSSNEERCNFMLRSHSVKGVFVTDTDKKDILCGIWCEANERRMRKELVEA